MQDDRLPKTSLENVRLPGSAAIACLMAFVSSTAFAAAPATQIPFRLDDNLVHVQASINGHTAEAVLDSGSGAILIDRQFAQTLDIKNGKAAGQALGGGSGAQTLFPATLSAIALGPIVLKNQSVMVLDNSNLTSSAGFPVQALLGQEFFAGQAITVDYPARRVTIHPARVAPSCRTPVPFELENGVPVVIASISADGAPERKVRLLVDLGTRHYAAMLGGDFLSSPAGQALARTGQATQVGTGVGGAVMGIRSVAAKLKVGNHVLHDVNVVTTEQVKVFSAGFAEGSLGVPFWQDGQITFDYPHRSLCFSEPARVPASGQSSEGRQRSADR